LVLFFLVFGVVWGGGGGGGGGGGVLERRATHFPGVLLRRSDARNLTLDFLQTIHYTENKGMKYEPAHVVFLKLLSQILPQQYKKIGPGSSVGIATCYGLDGTGNESRWGGEIFRT